MDHEVDPMSKGESLCRCSAENPVTCPKCRCVVPLRPKHAEAVWALDGIPDPAAYMQAVRRLVEAASSIASWGDPDFEPDERLIAALAAVREAGGE